MTIPIYFVCFPYTLYVSPTSLLFYVVKSVLQTHINSINKSPTTCILNKPLSIPCSTDANHLDDVIAHVVSDAVAYADKSNLNVIRTQSSNNQLITAQSFDSIPICSAFVHHTSSNIEWSNSNRLIINSESGTPFRTPNPDDQQPSYISDSYFRNVPVSLSNSPVDSKDQTTGQLVLFPSHSEPMRLTESQILVQQQQQSLSQSQLYYQLTRISDTTSNNSNSTVLLSSNSAAHSYMYASLLTLNETCSRLAIFVLPNSYICLDTCTRLNYCLSPFIITEVTIDE
ncbi:unnamed protein product [Heterobilharzia americana]|nr:unnamed protein product [Heterobilharzia americana]